MEQKLKDRKGMVNILKNKLPPNFIKMSASNEKSRKK